MTNCPNIDYLSLAKKTGPIQAFWATVRVLTTQEAGHEAGLEQRSKTPDHSGLPLSKGQDQPIKTVTQARARAAAAHQPISPRSR